MFYSVKKTASNYGNYVNQFWTNYYNKLCWFIILSLIRIHMKWKGSAALVGTIMAYNKWRGGRHCFNARWRLHLRIFFLNLNLVPPPSSMRPESGDCYYTQCCFQAHSLIITQCVDDVLEISHSRLAADQLFVVEDLKRRYRMLTFNKDKTIWTERRLVNI